MRISDWSSDVCSSDLQEDDALSEEEHALHNIPPVLPDEIKPLVGAFLKLTPRGEMVLDTEYYSEEPVSIGGADENGEDDHGDGAGGGGSTGPRSEEHTYELQSLMRISYAVFCLTKKTKYN